jgi:hypothetical protein
MIPKYFSSWAALLLMGFAVLAAPGPARCEILGEYVTVKACIECHAEHVTAWKKTPHGNAWETLKEQGAEKQGVAGCVKCHVVAYGQDGGFIDLELTPEFVNVQCENCHGPGKKHVEAGGEGHIIAKPDTASCRVCHTEGQDKNFDYARKSKLVHPLKR